MKTIIVYGGAFNPPTIAHQKILQAAIVRASEIPDAQVWIMPSGNRTDKSIETPAHVRVRLIEALLESVDHHGVEVVVETSELLHELPVETIDTVQRLQAEYDAEFIWIFGSDSIGTMRTWSQGERLWSSLPMWIVSRPGYLVDTLPPHAVSLEVVTPMTSSTLVRKMMDEGKDIGQLVPAEVYASLHSVRV